MRCIEILNDNLKRRYVKWLTLTWDVLKCKCTGIVWINAVGININMRCIEIAMQTTGKMAQQD